MTVSEIEVSQEIVIGVRRSDPGSFQKLFELFESPLFNFIRLRIGDADAAEDILQETFIRIWEKRHRLDETRSIRSLIYTTAGNLCKNYLRDHAGIVHHNQLLENFPADHTPHSLMEADEFQNLLKKAIDRLPNRTREVFLFSRIGDLSYREIAQVLSISEKTVENHIGTALKKIREAIKNFG